MKIITGDQVCGRCGKKYFSKGATDKMTDHELCFDCVLKYYRYIFGDHKIISVKEWLDANL